MKLYPRTNKGVREDSLIVGLINGSFPIITMFEIHKNKPIIKICLKYLEKIFFFIITKIIKPSKDNKME